MKYILTDMQADLALTGRNAPNPWRLTPARSAADSFIELRVIMIEPDHSDIGRKVIYRVHGSAKVKEGVITRFNEKYVFVRFGKEEKSTVATRDELEWKDARSRS